jgi:hypothetical protein
MNLGQQVGRRRRVQTVAAHVDPDASNPAQLSRNAPPAPACPSAAVCRWSSVRATPAAGPA